MQHVDLTVTAGIATITLDRPDKLNAFTDLMEAELIASLDACDRDPVVRVVVLTGAGRAFCAGMDLSDSGGTFEVWRAGATAPPGSTFEVLGHELPVRRDGGGRVVLRMFEMDKPILAAVNGPAVGVGATMVLAADIRLASDTATFGFVFGRRGVVPESCSSWFLPRVVPVQTALEWVLTGRIFPAAEARDQGLVRSVHPAGDLMEATYSLAREIADRTAPVSAALSRRMLWRMLGADHPMTAHHVETLALNLRGLSADVREGIAAFLDKRMPVFTDQVPRDVPDVFGTLPTPVFDPTKMEQTP